METELKKKLDLLLEQKSMVRNKLEQLTFQVIQPNDGNVPQWVHDLRNEYCAESKRLQREIEILVKGGE